MLRKLNLLALLLTLITSFADGQSFYAIRRNRNLLVSAGSGTANYLGEMVNPGKIGIIKPNIAIGAEYYLTSRISARAELTWFQLSGDDAKANDDRQERNLSFRSNNIELSAVGVINLSPMGLRFYQRSQLNFHAFLGIGLLHFNPKAKYQGDWVALQPLQTENKKYSRFQPVFPIGIGARIKVDPFFNILIEGGYRITFTDYLDDVSTRKYIDPALLKSDLTRALADRRVEGYVTRGEEIPSTYNKPPDQLYKVGKRGNPDKNDWYFIGNITLQYYLPVEVFQNSQRKLYNSKRKAYYRRRR
jgi:hypothetical protein